MNTHTPCSRRHEDGDKTLGSLGEFNSHVMMSLVQETNEPVQAARAATLNLQTLHPCYTQTFRLMMQIF